MAAQQHGPYTCYSAFKGAVSTEYAKVLLLWPLHLINKGADHHRGQLFTLCDVYLQRGLQDQSCPSQPQPCISDGAGFRRFHGGG